jgi:hypothetical protein
MKAFLGVVPALLLAPAFAADAPARTATHRYMIERTFPAGALEGLNAETKAKVNANNARAGVRWLQSYANEDKTRTYCLYEGPSEAAIRESAKLNALPIDSITEVPVDVDSGKPARSAAVGGKRHRYLVERQFSPGAIDGLHAAAKTKVNIVNEKFGVTWVGSYANADKTVTYFIYEAPDETAVRRAAMANNLPVGTVTEIPVTLLPQ